MCTLLGCKHQASWIIIPPPTLLYDTIFKCTLLKNNIKLCFFALFHSSFLCAQKAMHYHMTMGTPIICQQYKEVYMWDKTLEEQNPSSEKKTNTPLIEVPAKRFFFLSPQTLFYTHHQIQNNEFIKNDDDWYLFFLYVLVMININ